MDVRGPDGVAVLRARPLGVEERSLEVDADDLRAGRPFAGDAGDGLDGILQIAARCGERRGRQRGGAVQSVETEDARGGVFVRVHEVGAVTAMDVEIDESGNENPVDVFRARGQLRGLFDVEDDLLFDGDEHVFAQCAIDEGAAVEVFHGVFLISRSFPAPSVFPRWRRRRW